METEAERLCLCDYGYTRGETWQPGGMCPPGYVASFPRPAEIVEVPVQHPRSDCDAGVWGNGRRTVD